VSHQTPPCFVKFIHIGDMFNMAHLSTFVNFTENYGLNRDKVELINIHL